RLPDFEQAACLVHSARRPERSGTNLEAKIGCKRSLRIIANLLRPRVELGVGNSLNLAGENEPASPIPADKFPHRGAINCALRIRIVPYQFHNYLPLRRHSCLVE